MKSPTRLTIWLNCSSMWGLAVINSELGTQKIRPVKVCHQVADMVRSKMKNNKKKKASYQTKTCLSFPTYVLLEREKSSATKDMMKSVPVALLTFFAANNNLSVSFSAA